MKKFVLPVTLCIAATGAQAQEQVPDIMPLQNGELLNMELDSIPPFPDEAVLKGRSENWLTTLHQGDFLVAIYESTPAMINISNPYPYDEFVHILEGEVTLTHIDGDKQTYREGERFLVPKGWIGTWDMPVKFRELIVIETDAWERVGMPD